MRSCVAALAVVVLATPAAAQSTYVGGSAVYDLARFEKVEFDNDLPRITGGAASGDGEALGFNLRVGRALAERWGLEFEFARSGEFDNSVSYGVPFLTDFTSLPLSSPSRLSLSFVSSSRPNSGSRITARGRGCVRTSAAAWT